MLIIPLVPVLTGFHCTCNKYSCGTKRNPNCCSQRVGNIEPGSEVSLKGWYTLGNKLQQHVTTTRRSDKSLRVYWRIFVKIFVSAYHEFCRSNMLQKIKLARICATCHCRVKKFCCRDKDFYKISPVHTKQFVTTMCYRNMLL